MLDTSAPDAVHRSPAVVSGITPSGSLTLGNYLGALRRFVAEQQQTRGHFFIADLHALTTDHDPIRLHDLTLETATLFFATGLDLSSAAVFVQSHVRAHVELAYLLECTAYVGELSRMIQFKQKGGRPRTRASLFSYPCLMAADILLYDADMVPVGGDQDQHVELCRNLAVRFNRLYGETFVVPELAKAVLGSRVADLAEPRAKMSKSSAASSAGVIRMLDDPDLVVRKINRAVTDSEGKVRYDPVRKPGVSNLLDLAAALCGENPCDVAETVSSYGELKRRCADLVVAELTPIQQRYHDLAHHPDYVRGMLTAGAQQATVTAEQVLARARQNMGLLM